MAAVDSKVAWTRRDALGLIAAVGTLSVGPAGSAAAQAGPPLLPSAAQLKDYEDQWIDPVKSGSAGTDYALYPTPSRGKDTQGSYRVYLPPQYVAATMDRFPVIYWLHGGFGNSRDGAPAIERLDRAIRAGTMPPHIVIVPHALPGGWYVDSKDGARPVEQVLTFDLVGHVDRTYRTRAESRYRTIEGMSMGGYGALRLGLKHPEIFGRISAVAPSILKDMGQEPPERTQDTFFGDQHYYDAVGPWNLALANCPQVRRSSKLRLLSGGADERLVPTLRDFDVLLKSLDIPHEFIEVPGAGHDYRAIVDGIGSRYFTFWKDA
jgi:enterochelin esterase-like enzyme